MLTSAIGLPSEKLSARRAASRGLLAESVPAYPVEADNSGAMGSVVGPRLSLAAHGWGSAGAAAAAGLGLGLGLGKAAVAAAATATTRDARPGRRCAEASGQKKTAGALAPAVVRHSELRREASECASY